MFEYSKNLRNEFKICYLCFDLGLPKVSLEKVHIFYLKHSKYKFINWLNLSFNIIFNSYKGYNYMFMVYYKLCFLTNIFSQTPIILDFRTGSLKDNYMLNLLDNYLMRIESIFFKKISIISDGLRKKINISKSKSFINPLGASVNSVLNKKFDNPKLFYIGTLYKREISKTITGVYLFLKQHPNYKNKLTYDIVGYGKESTEAKIIDLINKYKLSDNIKFHGRKKHNQCKLYFDECNIGVSFIPMTHYFDYQPPTKTFEYLFSGMACIATSTYENSKIINDLNGILTKDNAESFSENLFKLLKNFSNYNSNEIRKSVLDHSWSKISNRLKINFFYD